MANTFQLKRSSVQGRVPTTSQLALGEIGINTYDGKLYIKKDDGTASIVEVGGSTSSNFTGATSSTAGAAGLVPAPSAGDQAKYLQADGTWSVPTDTNTTYNNATTSVSGLMSNTDKSKLDGIQSNAKNFSVGVGLGTASTANGNGYLSASNTNYSNSSVGTVTFNPPDLSVYYKSGSTATLGSLVVDGTIDSGASDYAGYRSDGTNIVLKGDASGRSGIFFQSEKNGTNINHPSDYGYIQFHPYGIDGSSGEANRLVIGVANDSTDQLVLQSPYKNGVKISFKDATSGTGGTEYTVWHAGNDGASSGLDADLLDGQHGSYYLNYNNFTNTPTIISTSSANTFTASQTISTGKATNPNNDDPSTYDRLLFDNSHNSTAEGPNKIQLYNDSANNWSAGFGVHSGTMAYYSGDYHRFYDQTGAQGNSANFTELLAFNSSNLTYKSNTIWHAGNDGSSSGLDADLLDGLHASSFLRSNAADSATGLITFSHNDGIWIKPTTNGTGAQIRFSDNSGGSYAQYGTIEYLHADGAVTTTGGNSNDGFVIKGTETRTVVKVEGDIIATGTIYDGTSRVLTTADEGSGNGLDADTLDAQQGSYYLDYNNFTNTPTIPSTSSFITTSSGDQTKIGRVTFGSNVYNDRGISILHSGNASGYGSIRGYDGNTSSNNNTIHFFSDSWTSGGTTSGISGSQGCINLSGSSGVTIGPWNNPHAYVENNILGVRGDGSATRGSLKLFRDNNNYAVTLAPSNSLATNYTLTLPTSTGSSGQVLATDGNGVTSWTTVSSGGISSVIQDTTPALGGNLNANSNNILFGSSSGSSNNRVRFGTNSEFEMYFHNTLNCGMVQSLSSNINVYLGGFSGQFFEITDNSLNPVATFTKDQGVELYWRGSTGAGRKLQTTSSGITVTGTVNATSFARPGGTSSQYLMADGSVSTGGGGGGGISNVVDDTTPQLGGNLDLNLYNITGTGNILINGHIKPSTNNVYNIGDAVNKWQNIYATNFYGNGTGLTNVLKNLHEDSTPALGGALDLSGYNIYSDASGLGSTYGDVTIKPIAASYGVLHGGLRIHCRDHTAGSTHYQYYFNGPNLTTPGSITASGNITAYSDIKLKKEIKPIESALDKVLKINGVTFERTDLKTQSRFAGVIAQEVEAVLPEVVSTDESGYKSVAYGNLVSLLIEAVKEQQTQINELKEALNNG